MKIRSEQRLMSALLKALRAAGDALRRELFAEIAKHGELRYVGVWKPDAEYKHGNFVTFNGSLWHCDTELCKNWQPGTDASGASGPNHVWTLAVKSGREKPGAELGSVVVKVEADVAAIERAVADATRAVEALEARIAAVHVKACPHMRGFAEFMTELHGKSQQC